MLFNKPLGRLTVDSALKVLKGEKVADFMPAPVFGIDTPTAQAIAAGDISAVPSDLAPEVKARVLKAKASCK
jgi:hypothetical protein